MEPFEWFCVAMALLGNVVGLISLWTKTSVTLNTFEMRIQQLEKDRQEARTDVKNLTMEVHNLVVEMARNYQQPE